MTVSNGKRVLAFLADFVIVDFVINRPLNKIIRSSISEDFSLLDLANGSTKLIIASLIVGLIGVFYWTILEYKVGQTIGGMLFDIRAKGIRGKFSLGISFLRNLSKMSVVFLIFDSINIFFTEKKQRFLEAASNTFTVEGK